MRSTVWRMRSWLAWLMLMRNTSAPALASSSIIFSSWLAGPRVARIFARLIRLIAFPYLEFLEAGAGVTEPSGRHPHRCRSERPVLRDLLRPPAQQYLVLPHFR